MIIALTTILAGLLAAYLTPMIRKGAIRFRVLDQPDGRLKSHPQAVPYLGGVAVYLAYLLSISLVYEYSSQVLGLLLAGTIVMTLGLFDDFRVLTPSVKLMGQILAAVVLIKAGIRIHVVYLPEWVAIGLSVLWVVGIINAINIIDVSDGLSSSVTVVAAAYLCAISVINGNVTIAVLTGALVGAILGFFPFNRAPASIYLGDTGSMFIGLVLGAVSLINQYAPIHHVSLLAPVAILLVPIFDTGFVMASRLAQGRSPFLGSPDHFAIRLKQRGWSARGVAWLALLASLATGGVAVGSMYVTQGLAIGLYSGLLALALGAAVWLWRVNG